MKTQKNDIRRRDLAKIHIAKKQLGMDDETYRDMLLSVAGVESAGDLDAKGRRAVLDHLRDAGFRAKGRRKPFFPGRPRQSCFDDPDKGPMLRKVEALLAEAKRPWKYAHAMAEQMAGVKRIEWCTRKQLHDILVALIYDARRHGRYLP